MTDMVHINTEGVLRKVLCIECTCPTHTWADNALEAQIAQAFEPCQLLISFAAFLKKRNTHVFVTQRSVS